jgi:predicted GNAT superfamily acetyltransferase
VSIEIREYHPDDLTDVHAINQGEVPRVGSETVEALAHIAAESILAPVAIDAESGEVLGFAMVLGADADYSSDNYAWFRERYADFVYLDRVAIPPAHQRRGIGRALYDYVGAHARAVRPTASDWTLEVNLRPRNERSLAFHTAMGFVEVGQHESRHGYLVAMMSKPLG